MKGEFLMEISLINNYKKPKHIFAVKRERKNLRILRIYDCLRNGDGISKYEEAVRSGVSEKTIQRDINDIRAYYAEQRVNGGGSFVVVFNKKKRFYLEKEKI